MKTYFLNNAGNSLVKIGKSNNVSQRITQIQTGCPFTLHELYVIDGNYEGLFHQFYAKFRQDGEWFDIPDLTVGKIITDLAKIQRGEFPETEKTAGFQIVDKSEIFEDWCNVIDWMDKPLKSTSLVKLNQGTELERSVANEAK